MSSRATNWTKHQFKLVGASYKKEGEKKLGRFHFHFSLFNTCPLYIFTVSDNLGVQINLKKYQVRKQEKLVKTQPKTNRNRKRGSLCILCCYTLASSRRPDSWIRGEWWTAAEIPSVVEILPCTPIIKSITLTKFIIPLRKMFIPIQQLHLAQQVNNIFFSILEIFGKQINRVSLFSKIKTNFTKCEIEILPCTCILQDWYVCQRLPKLRFSEK